MYYIYKEQAYLAALKAANRLSQSNTVGTVGTVGYSGNWASPGVLTLTQ